jgi:hypothetical protein
MSLDPVAIKRNHQGFVAGNYFFQSFADLLQVVSIKLLQPSHLPFEADEIGICVLMNFMNAHGLSHSRALIAAAQSAFHDLKRLSAECILSWRCRFVVGESK